MNAEKMLEVIDRYRKTLKDVSTGSGPFDTRPTSAEALAHVRGMLDTIEEFVLEGNQVAWDKANRWLGFIQGVFWLLDEYSLNQMRDHNRTEGSKNVD